MTKVPENQADNRDKTIFARMKRFFQMEAAGGMMLVLAGALALSVANTSYYPLYHDFWSGVAPLGKSLLHWVNDALMAIFFFLVGLEIKREIVIGELSSRDRMLLPVIGAIGGMVVPALIYIGININHPENWSGWAIPSATDIAFSIGVLAVLGSRVPISVKILLTAIAIVDDLGAIIIIAFFYSTPASLMALAVAAVAFAGLIGLNRANMTRISPYMVIGAILWLALLKSGIHPTLAGVMTAICIPMTANPGKLEHALHPWVAFGILPIFAFANAGVPFQGMGWHSVFDPVALGIAAGLLIGKTIGIFAALAAAIALKISPMPSGSNWIHLLGVAMTAGIGFTMSLFIGELAFSDVAHQASIRLGVLSGSLLAAVGGYSILCLAAQKTSST